MTQSSSSDIVTPFPTPTRSQQAVDVIVFTDIPYWEWLVAGIVIACLIIIGVIITVIVIMCKKKNTQVYADHDSPSDDYEAGHAKVLNVYRLKETE